MAAVAHAHIDGGGRVARALAALEDCRTFPWTPSTLAMVPIERLHDVELWCDWLRQLAKRTAQHRLKARFGDTALDDVQRLCMPKRPYAFGGKQHVALATSAARHVVEIAPFAHASPVLKQRLRTIVGHQYFTRVASAGTCAAFRELVGGCKAHMTRKGQWLQKLYRERGLHQVLGQYQPRLLSELSVVVSPAAVLAVQPGRRAIGDQPSSPTTTTTTMDTAACGGSCRSTVGTSCVDPKVRRRQPTPAFRRARGGGGESDWTRRTVHPPVEAAGVGY